MAFREMTRLFRLREDPRMNAKKLQTLPGGTILKVVNDSVGDDGDWVEVIASLSFPAPGFVPKAHTKEIDPPAAPNVDIDEERFVRSSTRAAKTINARHARGRLGVNRDYLVALAWLKSRLKNKASDVADSTEFGPFQFSEVVWKSFLDDLGGRARGFGEADRRHPYMQCYAAAQYTYATAEALSIALTPDPEPSDGRFIPNGIELYVAQAIGVLNAATLLQSTDVNKSIKEQLKPLYDGKEDELDAILQANKGLFTKANGTPKSLKDAIQAVEKALEDGFKKAFDLASQYLPDELGPGQTRRPPWMDTAEAELARTPPVKERGTPPHPQIIKYFESTSYKAKTEEPWCAAFVSFCMDKANVENRASARAADWITWGHSVSKPPYGAVAVLSPLSSGASGHVGFVTALDSTHVELLGGNQSDALNRTRYPKSKVRDYRYLNWGAGAINPGEPDRNLNPDGVPSAKYNVTFRSLVAGGFYSFDPDDMSVRRSIRTNNPGAINISQWQQQFPGYAGKTRPDSSQNQNRTTIYATPEHGVAAWYHLLTHRYGFGNSLVISALADRYAGGTGSQKYIDGWRVRSGGKLKKSTRVDLNDNTQVLVLAHAMFAYEAGQRTPLHDTQIIDGITRLKNSNLPSN